jgi:hypothetical protein
MIKAVCRHGAPLENQTWSKIGQMPPSLVLTAAQRFCFPRSQNYLKDFL